DPRLMLADPRERRARLLLRLGRGADHRVEDDRDPGLRDVLHGRPGVLDGGPLLHEVGDAVRRRLAPQRAAPAARGVEARAALLGVELLLEARVGPPFDLEAA